VQVIDLPGGNHRFADFSFGVEMDAPHFTQIAPAGPISREVPSVVAAAIRGVPESELREMWLHVRAPEGTWKRYPMTLMRAPAGIVGVAVFPTAMLDDAGGTPYYVSAMSQVGDEYFTELRNARARAAAPARTDSRPPRSGASGSRVAPPAVSTPPAAVDPSPATTPATGASTP
jgi:hypothetical protein